ncbi:hypothetical protein SLS60_011919 [Paraconiothyrium brasiliense]|uniref:Uncharacterized protein n=1 Tax=Paraconiothyrium brasiliense TaxID=300254 RepID=A0ABR3QH87_9PLEO
MSLSQEHIKNLSAIIEKHGMTGILGFHLLHRHDPIPEGQIKLAMELSTVPNGKWNKPVSIDSLNPEDIHGTMFRFVRGAQGEGCFVPFELGKGPSPDVKGSCVEEMAAYFTKYELEHQVALQVLDSHRDGNLRECTAEVELGMKNGTVALPVSMLKRTDLLATGWSGAAQQHNESDSGPGPNETWQKQVVKDKETHRVFVSQAENEEELLQELVHNGVIHQ